METWFESSGNFSPAVLWSSNQEGGTNLPEIRVLLNNRNLWADANGGGKLQIEAWDGSSYHTVVTGTHYYGAGPHQLDVVWDGPSSTMTVYGDGVSEATLSHSFSSPPDLLGNEGFFSTLGNHGSFSNDHSTSDGLLGWMQATSIFDSALSQSDIQSNFNAATP